MGIKGFHKFIREKYPSCLQHKWSDSYEHCYIDINFALHFCSYNVSNVDQLYMKLFGFFDNILKDIVPTKSLTIAADGAAPLSKLLLQRKRRLTNLKKISKKTTDDSDSDAGSQAVTSLMFTPGTLFMKNLKENMSAYMEYISKSYGIDVEFMDINFDEAELKLKYAMMENINKYDNDSHIIVTNDADVIVMLGTLEKFHNAYVHCKSNHQNEVLSIGKLLECHTNYVGCSLHPGLDFAATGILLGNDYIPKLNFISPESIWIAYKSTLKGHTTGLILDRNMKINRTFFAGLMGNIVTMLKSQYVKKLNYRNVCHPLYRNYLDGYTWCLATYNNGKCQRYNYMYEFSDYPHPLGLLLNVRQFPDITKHDNQIYKCIRPELYAILVLPKSSLKLIPKKYAEMSQHTEILYDEEFCHKCNKFNDDNKKLTKELSDDPDNKKLKKQINELKKNKSTHRKQHSNICLDDIEDIIEKTKYVFK